MPEMLTARGVAAARARAKARDIRDADVHGLILRVAPSGVKSWCVWGRRRGSPRPLRIGLGRWPRVSLSRAREQARVILRELEAGHVVRAAELEEDTRTIALLGKACLDALAPRLRPSTRSEWQRMLAREIVPALGDLAPSAVSRHDVRALMARKARTAPVMANRVFELLRRIYRWANETDRLAGWNPCAGLRAITAERRRDRVLSSEEISAVWAAAAHEGALGQALRLLLLTGARRGEVLGMRWADVDEGEKLWRLPGEQTKGGDPHVVPLGPMALEILDGMQRRTPWVFPAPSLEGPVRWPWHAGHRVSLRAGAAFRIHDLRRTVATRLAELGTRSEVIEAVLGHARPGLTRTYQLYSPVKEMRAALMVWEAALREIIEVKDRPKAGPRRRAAR